MIQEKGKGHSTTESGHIARKSWKQLRKFRNQIGTIPNTGLHNPETQTLLVFGSGCVDAFQSLSRGGT